MRQVIIGLIAGVVSGLCTYQASVYALAYTSAFTKPREFPMMVWQSLVVFGLGAFAVALVVHLLVLRFSPSKPLLSLLGFLVTLVTVLAASGVLIFAHKTLLSWSLGSVLASALCILLRTNLSSKRMRKKPRAT